MCVVGSLTVYPSPSQISPGRDLSSGSNCSWVSHNASSTGSSKLLQQHAKETAVPPPLDVTSS